MSVLAQSPFTAGTKRLFDDENDAPRGGEGGSGGGGSGDAATAAAAARDSPLGDGRCKRVRFAAGSSSSPARAVPGAGGQQYPAHVHPATFAALCALFPGMDDRVVSGVLAECGSDVDAAIRRLTQLRLEAGGGDGGSSGGVGGGGSDAGGSAGAAAPPLSSAPASEAGGGGGGGGASEAAAAADGAAGNGKQQPKQPQTGEQWTDALVSEMAAARDLHDARGRASKLLAAFEGFVAARREQARAGGAGAPASTAPSTPTGAHGGSGGGGRGGSSTPVLQTPGGTLRSADDLVRENAILKRAVQVQHARLQQVMLEGAGGGGGQGAAAIQQQQQQQAAENEALRRALNECQQRVRVLETTNYALALHLQRAAFGGGDGGMGGGGGGNGNSGGDGGGGDGGGYFPHPFQPPPPPDVF